MPSKQATLTDRARAIGISGRRRDSVSSLGPVQINHEASYHPQTLEAWWQPRRRHHSWQSLGLPRLGAQSIPCRSLQSLWPVRLTAAESARSSVCLCFFPSDMRMAANGATTNYGAVRRTLLVLTTGRSSIVFFGIGFKPIWSYGTHRPVANSALLLIRAKMAMVIGGLANWKPRLQDHATGNMEKSMQQIYMSRGSPVLEAASTKSQDVTFRKTWLLSPKHTRQLTTVCTGAIGRQQYSDHAT